MYNYHIGEYIKRKREEQKIKQDELCYGICDRSTLSRIERGKQEPSYYILKALLQRLGISEDRCQILMGAQEFEIAELQKEIVADNVRHDFSSALKKICRLEELYQSAENPLLRQFILRVRALAGYEKNGERLDYDNPTQRKMLIHALELTCPGISMENMGTILVDMDSVYIFTVNISCDVISLFYNKAGFSMFFCFMSKNGTEQSGTDNQVIVHNILLWL